MQKPNVYLFPQLDDNYGYLIKNYVKRNLLPTSFKKKFSSFIENHEFQRNIREDRKF